MLLTLSWTICHSHRCLGKAVLWHKLEQLASGIHCTASSLRSTEACGGPVVLRLQCASESPGGLVETQITGPTPRDSESDDPGWGLRICTDNRFPGWSGHHSMEDSTVDPAHAENTKPMTSFASLPAEQMFTEVTVTLSFMRSGWPLDLCLRPKASSVASIERATCLWRKLP